jgi:DNA-binding PadR family transcriptional regulator
MATTPLERELKRGSAEILILALLEERQRHGYEIGRLIADRSRGAINFHVASLYPTLYRLEDRRLIEGRWVEKAGQRRRRYYKLTREGRAVLARQRGIWDSFFIALDRVARIRLAGHRVESARPHRVRAPHAGRRRPRGARAARGGDV